VWFQDKTSARDQLNTKHFPPPPHRHLTQPSVVIDTSGHIILFYLPGIIPPQLVVSQVTHAELDLILF
jgi:hypothetical protein